VALGGLVASALAAAASLTVLAGSGSAARAAIPQNTTKPTISGTAQVGRLLTADPGNWQSSSNITFTYQWRRCNKGGSNCGDIKKATDKLYTVRRNDAGQTLKVAVTATNSDGKATEQSNATDVVLVASAQAPQNTALPTITGTTTQGQTLTAHPGTWIGTNPINFTFRWRMCDPQGGNCSDTNTSGDTYSLGANDVGKTLRVLVTAENSAGSSAAVSDPTPAIQSSGGGGGGGGGNCKSIDSISLPNQLLIDRIEYNPTKISSASQPLVARFHVVSTAGGCVSGALVYAVGVPFDRLSKAPETPTGGDGWATITFNILPTFQLKHGNLVVIFVRARKPHDSILTGVSTRRLVSVRVA